MIMSVADLAYQLDIDISAELAWRPPPAKYTANISPNAAIEVIRDMVCEAFGVNRLGLDSARRSRELAHPRMIAMWLCRDLTGLTTPVIGRKFGGRDHTTVLNAWRKVDMVFKEHHPEKYKIAQDLRRQFIRRYTTGWDV